MENIFITMSADGPNSAQINSYERDKAALREAKAKGLKIEYHPYFCIVYGEEYFDGGKMFKRIFNTYNIRKEIAQKL